jgi:hypothetical protein
MTMRKRTEARLADGMVSAYVDWHQACRLARASQTDPLLSDARGHARPRWQVFTRGLAAHVSD